MERWRDGRLPVCLTARPVLSLFRFRRLTVVSVVCSLFGVLTSSHDKFGDSDKLNEQKGPVIRGSTVGFTVGFTKVMQDRSSYEVCKNEM